MIKQILMVNMSAWAAVSTALLTNGQYVAGIVTASIGLINLITLGVEID